MKVTVKVITLLHEKVRVKAGFLTSYVTWNQTFNLLGVYFQHL